MSSLSTSTENLRKVFAPMMAVAPEHEPKSRITVETRFGVIEFDRSNILTFPKGIPGFKGYSEFGLTQIPIGQDQNMVLLQSVEPSDLAFFVCSYDPTMELIKSDDLSEACDQLGIRQDDCAIVLIANFHKKGEETQISVNLRAPLLIDTANLLAWQHILADESYPVRHFIEWV